MSKTYQTFYQNEVRALEITVRDQDGNEYPLSDAQVAVTDANGDVVIANQSAQVTSNKVSTIISTTVTAQVGIYHVLWTLRFSDYTYKHVTELEVRYLV